MLFNIITKDISVEIMVIYGLIAITIMLIVFMVVLDKKEKKKRIITRTQELRLMDLRKSEENYTKEFKKQPLARDTELKSIVHNVKKEQENIEVIEEVQEEVVLPVEPIEEKVVETIKLEDIPKVREELLIDEDMYIEDDLEKTSAQIQLEMLAKELEKAQELEEAKIRRFEAEQEENAIISYNELLKVCDELYDKNEKIQYMDEGNEPINLEELRSRFQNQTSIDTPRVITQEIELLD